MFTKAGVTNWEYHNRGETVGARVNSFSMVDGIVPDPRDYCGTCGPRVAGHLNSIQSNSHFKQ